MKLNFVIKELNEKLGLNVKFNSKNISDYIIVNKILEPIQFFVSVKNKNFIHISRNDLNILDFLGLKLYKNNFEFDNMKDLSNVTLTKFQLEYDLETLPKNFFE